MSLIVLERILFLSNLRCANSGTLNILKVFKKKFSAVEPSLWPLKIIAKQKDGASLQTVLGLFSQPQWIGVQQNEQIWWTQASSWPNTTFSADLLLNFPICEMGTVVSASWHYLRMSHIRSEKAWEFKDRKSQETLVITVDQVQMWEPERNFSYNKNVLEIQFDVYIFANPPSWPRRRGSPPGLSNWWQVLLPSVFPFN